MELRNLPPHTAQEWSDWRWQLANAVRTPSQIPCWNENADGCAARRYPMFATPFYLSLAQSDSPADPILMQALPHAMELEGEALPDPLGEHDASPVPRLVHRYRDRALFMTCDACSIRCRHCMRKRVWDTPVPAPTDEELARVTDYLTAHTEIREVLISGGDPLVLPDTTLARILGAFAKVPNLEVLRIGSRTPVALPQRFTPELCELLGNTGKTVWLAAHFNHPQELSPEAAEAMDRVVRHGVPVINQTVLLKGINDNAATLGRLFTGLLKMKVKPYYLFHGDPVQGTLCFRTGIQAGIDILDQLWGHVSGLAIPTYAFDLPEGGGKVRLEPNFCTGQTPDGAPIFRKIDGSPIAYR